MFGTSPLKAKFLAVAACLLLSQTANASLIGDTITVQMTGIGAETINVVVGDGVEISDFGNLIPGEFIDIGASAISGHWEGVAFSDPQTIILSDLDWSGAALEIVGIANFLSDDASFSAAAISFSSDSITIDISNLAPLGDWSFDILTREAVVDPGGVAISEPSVALIFALAVAGFGFVRRPNRHERPRTSR